MTAAVAHAKTRPDPLRATWIGARNLKGEAARRRHIPPIIGQVRIARAA
jgi:hypothetical protein